MGERRDPGRKAAKARVTHGADEARRTLSFMSEVRAYSLVTSCTWLLLSIFWYRSSTSSSVTCDRASVRQNGPAH